jgi:predicted GIY-YIG superfamily endonuclease
MQTVYGLVDQLTDLPFYIGITDTPLERYLQHLSGAGDNEALYEHIQKLIARGYVPYMKTYQQLSSRAEALVKESYWIHHFLGLGVTLYNRQIPHPLHLRSRKEQEAIKERVSRSKILAGEDERPQILRLHAQQVPKKHILSLVYNVRPGGSKRYKLASSTFEQIIQEGSTSG